MRPPYDQGVDGCRLVRLPIPEIKNGKPEVRLITWGERGADYWCVWDIFRLAESLSKVRLPAVYVSKDDLRKLAPNESPDARPVYDARELGFRNTSRNFNPATILLRESLLRNYLLNRAVPEHITDQALALIRKALLVHDASGAGSQGAKQRSFRCRPRERVIMEDLFTAIDRHGRFVASEMDGPKAAVGKVAVDFADYLAVARARHVGDGDEPKERAAEEFQKIAGFLETARVIGKSKPLVWWEGKPIEGFPRTLSLRPPVAMSVSKQPTTTPLRKELGQIAARLIEIASALKNDVENESLRERVEAQQEQIDAFPKLLEAARHKAFAEGKITGEIEAGNAAAKYFYATTNAKKRRRDDCAGDEVVL